MRIFGAIVLSLFWCSLWGDFSPQNLVLGFVLSLPFIIPRLFIIPTFRLINPVRLYFIARFLAHLFYEIILANLKVFLLVISGRIKPGIIAFDGEVEDDMEVVMLSNSITLTPGTFTIFVDGRRLYVHTLYIDDPSSVRENIRGRLEKYILGATRCLKL